MTTEEEWLEEGRRRGAEAERERIAAIVSHESISGNIVRLTAALEIAREMPTKSAESVIAFVEKHVASVPAVSVASLANRDSLPNSLDMAQEARDAGKKDSWI